MDKKTNLRKLLLACLVLCSSAFFGFVLDIAFRFSNIINWNLDAIGIYFLSFLISLGFWQLLVILAYLLKKYSKITAVAFLTIILLGISFIYIASLRAYSYFGFIPNYYIIDYIFTEPDHFWQIVQEYLPPLLGFLFLLAFIFGISVWYSAKENFILFWKKRALLISGTILWIASLLVLNNNLRFYDQSSVPDTNFYLITAQIIFNRITARKLGTCGLKYRIAPQLPKIAGEPKFNILILVQEGLRPDHTSIYGYHRDTTPHLKAFLENYREETFLFPLAMTNACSTFVSLSNICHGMNPSLPGKYWHTAPLIFEYAKMLDNVHTFFFTAQKLHWQNLDVYFNTPTLEYIWSKETSGLPRFNDSGVNDLEMVKRIISYISSLKSTRKKFLGLIMFNATHNPYIPEMPDGFRKWNGTLIDKYDNAILFLDNAIWTLLDYLEKDGWLDNTIIFFTSDHGEAFGEHGEIAGHNSAYFQEATRIPFWIFVPNSIQPEIKGFSNLKKNLKKVVCNQQITPTIVDLYGIYEHPSIKEYVQLFQGESLFRDFDENKPIFILTRTDISQVESHPGMAVVIGGKKYFIEVNNYNIIEHYFDLYKDPNEKIDLWQNLPESEKEKIHNLLLSYPNTKAIYKETVGRKKITN